MELGPPDAPVATADASSEISEDEEAEEEEDEWEGVERVDEERCSVRRLWLGVDVSLVVLFRPSSSFFGFEFKLGYSLS